MRYRDLLGEVKREIREEREEIAKEAAKGELRELLGELECAHCVVNRLKAELDDLLDEEV